MDNEMGGRERRQVHVQTIHGAIEGFMETGERIRTLDDLNMFHRKFLRIEEAVVSSPVWSFDRGTVGVNTSAILFVIERTRFKRKSNERVEASRFNRAAVRLCVGEYEIQGFLHVPGRGDILTRLNRDKYPFIALTSASVVGPDSEFAVPFLAVNRTHIMAAQELLDEESEPPAPGEEAQAELCHEA
jgi:hypothetical protein